MRWVTVEQIIRDEKNVRFPPTDLRLASYLLSYREFIAYFADLERITRHSLILGVYFTYGWMPTIPKLITLEPEQDFATAIAILNQVKAGRRAGETELRFLRDLINGSLMGTSRLLHFINPHIYAMWDSKVYKYINGKLPHQYQISKTSNYLAFLANCDEITCDERFHQVHTSMNSKTGYGVTPYRALEQVMYVTARGS